MDEAEAGAGLVARQRSATGTLRARAVPLLDSPSPAVLGEFGWGPPSQPARRAAGPADAGAAEDRHRQRPGPAPNAGRPPACTWGRKLADAGAARSGGPPGLGRAAHAAPEHGARAAARLDRRAA